MLGFKRTKPFVISTDARLFSNKVISCDGHINCPAQDRPIFPLSIYFYGGVLKGKMHMGEPEVQHTERNTKHKARQSEEDGGKSFFEFKNLP
jgi:hypothetical protein